MKNKNGAIPIVAILLLVVLAIFLLQGGGNTILQLTNILAHIPIFVWVIVGILFILKMLMGGRR